MQKPKILFVNASLRRGGTEHTLVRVAAWLHQRGWQTRACLTAAANSKDAFYSPLDGLDLIYVPVSPHHGLKRYLHVIAALRKQIVQWKPDIVLSMNSSQALDVSLATLFTHPKKVACERANPYLSMRGTVWYTIKRLASRRMDGYVFQTARAAAFYPPCVRKRMAVIPNMIEPLPENPYHPGSRVLLAVGNLRAEKGYDSLLSAFSLLRDLPEWRLVICGEGPLRPQLEDSIARLGLSGRAALRGNVSNVGDYYASAGAYILSSRQEGMPNTLLEAMSYGLPCLSTDCPMGPAELIRDGENGLLTPVGDPQAMAEKLRSLLTDEALRLRLSHAAFQIHETNSREEIGRLWEEYLTSLLPAER